MIFNIAGELTGDALRQFQDAVTDFPLEVSALILDLSEMTYIGADGLAPVPLDLSSRLREERQEVWLTGTRPRLHASP